MSIWGDWEYFDEYLVHGLSITNMVLWYHWFVACSKNSLEQYHYMPWYV